MRTGRREVQGYVYILAGTTLWGISSVVAKSLFTAGLQPMDLVLVRLTLSAFILLAIFLLFDRKRLALRPGDLPYFLVLGLVGFAGVQTTYYFTISKINIGPGTILQYLSPVWVTLFALLFQKEPLTKWKILSLLLAVLGCYLVMGGYRMDLSKLNRIGTASGILSSLCFAFYCLYGEKGLRRYDPWTIIFYGFAFGALFCWVVLSPREILARSHTLGTWLAFLYIAVFSTLIPFVFYFKGIERVRATRASISSTWEPVIASLTAYFVLGEILYPLQIGGGVAVIIAVAVLQLEREKTAPSTAMEIRRKGEG
jgi:drug/metabolite transporter (DMT)-like permease